MKTDVLTIESRSNPLIKSIRALSDAKNRRAAGLHCIEGDKLVLDAVRAGAPIETLLLEEGADFPAPEGVRTVSVSRGVLESICAAETPQHVLAVVHTPDTTAPERFPEGLIVLLDGVQDPGNAGTILRSADAFGAAGVLATPGSADPFSPKCLRAAMGSTYHLPVWRGDAAAALRRMKTQGFTALCGHLRGKESLPPLGKGVALVIGSEGGGVSEAVAEACIPYRLPMKGRAESLNAGVAAGILMYVVSAGMR